MKISKIKPAATLVAQFPQGVEVDAINHEGKLFLPVMSLGEFAPAEPMDEPEKPTRTKKVEPEDDTEDTAPVATTSYTEGELMEMSTKELLKICSDLDIDTDDGKKNTNKKLRNLILDAQEVESSSEEDAPEVEDEPEEAPKKGSDEPEDELYPEVVEILQKVDSGESNIKKATEALVDLAEDGVVTKNIKPFLDEMMKDDDLEVEDVAKRLLPVLRNEKPAKAKKTEDVDEEDEKPAKKGKAKKSKEPEVVEIDDLEEGDKINVYFEEHEEFYPGVVDKVSKKGVYVKYEDEDEGFLDPEENTEIHRL